jgi:RHS repeat-associated protein
LQGAGGVGGLLARTDIKGTIYYHSDGIGNVTTLFDKYQSLEGRYLYDPYGNIVGKWGAYADVNLYRYSSKEFHPLGLYYYGGRYYDPNLQRFVNQDPLGIASGPNPYEFVLNGPMMYFDPNGLYTFGEWASIAGAGIGGLGQGAENVGNAAYGLVAGPASLAGTLSTSSGRQQTANELAAAAALAKKYANDPCFREKMNQLLGDKAKDILSDPDKLSKFLANLGVLAGTAGLGGVAGGGADVDAALTELESMSPEMIDEAASAAQSGTALARQLGQAGEDAVGITGPKTQIQIPGTDRIRIPDQLTDTTLTEVKNVANQSFTQQLQDFSTYAQQTGRSFDLYVRPSTQLSGPLQQAIANGQISLKFIPGAK